MHTLFVESGTTTAEAAAAAGPEQRPDFIAESIAVLEAALVGEAASD